MGYTVELPPKIEPEVCWSIVPVDITKAISRLTLKRKRESEKDEQVRVIRRKVTTVGKDIQERIGRTKGSKMKEVLRNRISRFKRLPNQEYYVDKCLIDIIVKMQNNLE